MSASGSGVPASVLSDGTCGRQDQCVRQCPNNRRLQILHIPKLDIPICGTTYSRYIGSLSSFFWVLIDLIVEVIIYDDNKSYRSLSRAKRNIYIFFFYLFLKERSLVIRECPLSGLGAFKQHFFNEIHPEQFALSLHEAFWELRITVELLGLIQ